MSPEKSPLTKQATQAPQPSKDLTKAAQQEPKETTVPSLETLILPGVLAIYL